MWLRNQRDLHRFGSFYANHIFNSISFNKTYKKKLKTKNTMHADYPNRNNIIVSIQKIPQLYILSLLELKTIITTVFFSKCIILGNFDQKKKILPKFFFILLGHLLKISLPTKVNERLYFLIPTYLEHVQYLRLRNEKSMFSGM